MIETNPSLKIRSIIAWCFYDWANSSYSAVITTFVFATYFTQAVAQNPIVGTSQWGNAIALAGIIIAILSPIFGAIADRQGRRKPWLGAFTLLTVISASLLWFGKPNISSVYWVLTCVIFGNIGLEIGTVFYNAMLRDIAPANYLGRISGWAWGFGYLGGLICLNIALFGFIKGQQLAQWLHLNSSAAEHIRICGPLVAVWLGVFSLPLFFFTPDRKKNHIQLLASIKEGLTALVETFRKIKRYKEIIKFLLAQMIYIDGLNTLFAFGGIYAVGTFHMTFAEVLQFGIFMNVTAGLGAAGFAWLDDFLGAKETVIIALIAMIILSTSLLLIKLKILFWILALILGLFVGPVQAASRSLMARMSPPELTAEMFGLYAFSGKATSFLCPWLLALVTLHANSQRIGMFTIVVFLSLGLLLLLRVCPSISQAK